ncbi:MAG: hypothetical protein M0006_10485 [Magnetospirillum sp.]|nr:hypothetical protein [Magnetospirillum sp.]
MSDDVCSICTALDVFPPFPCPNCPSELLGTRHGRENGHRLADRLIYLGAALTVVGAVITGAVLALQSAPAADSLKFPPVP